MTLDRVQIVSVHNDKLANSLTGSQIKDVTTSRIKFKIDVLLLNMHVYNCVIRISQNRSSARDNMSEPSIHDP